MNINYFKEGDIITRNAPVKYGSDTGSEDSSWCGDRIILKGIDQVAKIIFLENTEKLWEGEIRTMSYARDRWDEGWCKYPENIWQKLIKKVTK